MKPQAPGNEPFWKSLFSDGDFSWVFRMRAGDAEAFFAPEDDGGALLAEKKEWLETRPELFTAITPDGENSVATLWEKAVAWGHVANPEGGALDLATLGSRWQPDILLMDRETMRVSAACVCMPSSWDPAHAVGKSMHDVHEEVPRLNPQIGDKIDRFLRQLQPGKAYRRENWGFTRTADLSYHPALRRPRLDATVKMEDIHLRVEHQLFTAIPGAILMGIRIRTCPLADLASDQEAWNAVDEKLATMPDDVAGYKGILSARQAMLDEMRAFPLPR